jgi:hypothetical protein
MLSMSLRIFDTTIDQDSDWNPRCWTLKQLGNIPLSSWCGTTTNALEQLWYQCDTQIGTWVAYINIADAHPQCFHTESS